MAKSLDELLKSVSDDVKALNPELAGEVIGRAEAIRISQDTLRRAEAESKPRLKYGNEPTVVDGIRFDSRKEARRYTNLMQEQEAGRIKHLRRQVSYELQPAFVTREGERIRAIHYVADFVYEREGVVVVEDTKSEITRKQATFVVKWKMLRYQYRRSIKMRFLLT